MYPFYKKPEVPKKVLDKIKQSEKPLVSIIIPSLLHRKELLRRAIESIEKQTYRKVEIIIEYGGKNVQNARNIASSKANGKYLAFLDDDDEFYPEKIEEQVKYMERNPETSLCITWGDDYKFGLYHLIKPKETWNFNELIEGFNISCTSSFLCRKSSFDAVGGMDETLDDSHEYDLALKLSCIGNVHCIQKSLVRFNESDDNWSDDFRKKIRGMFQFIDKWGFAFNARRWRNTIICLGLFSIGLVWGKPIHKIFNMVKEHAET